MMRYKIDVLRTLKNAGYSTYRLRKEKICGEMVIQNIREGKMMPYAQLEKICNILNCDIGDLVTVEMEQR